MSKSTMAKLTMRDAVVRGGDKFQIPEKLSIKEAIIILDRELRYQEEVVEISEEIPGSIPDSAYAFTKALERTYGWVRGEPTFFGMKPPEMLSVPCGVGKTVLVPWGEFSVPGVDGKFGTSMTRDNRGRYVFVLKAIVKRKHEEEVRALAVLTRSILDKESLYRGKAIKARFTTDEGEEIPMVLPEFMDVTKAVPGSLILSEKVEAAVWTSVFTPIMYPEGAKKLGVPGKRGALFAGVYGTGKTLAAYVAAHLCEKAGRTFILVERADELTHALRFAHQLGGRVMVFCEDVDRVMAGERNISIDDILNVIDGIESKDSETMVVLTTNDAPAITQAMVRPGRLDVTIEFLPPDAGAVAKLIRFYAGGLLDADADIKMISETLADQGLIPAIIREMVERAKLSQLKLNNGVVGSDFQITPEALMDSYYTMEHQLRLLKPKEKGLGGHEALGKLLKMDPAGIEAATIEINR